MEKLHNVVKHFSSASTNRKKYDSTLDEHWCLPTNQLEQDHNGISVVAVHRLLKSSFRLKTGTHFYCTKFNAPPFLIDEEWKILINFEAILRDVPRLTTVFQEEERLNGAHGSVVRKFLHDSLSSRTMRMINSDLWSSQKAMIHPTRKVVNINSFTDTGRTYLKRPLLECEISVFNDKTEIIFTKQSYEFCVNSTNRERSLLVLDKRICWSRSVLQKLTIGWIEKMN